MVNREYIGPPCAGLKHLFVTVLLSTMVVFSVPLISPMHNSAIAQVTNFFRIDVAGNQRIASDTIRSIAGISPGIPVTPAEVNDGLQRLVASGLFEKVDIRVDRGNLVIEVVENPTINRISIEGNQRLADDVLLAVVGSQPRRAFSVTQAEADVKAIADAYETAGRLFAEVKPKIIRLSDNRVDLVFEVFEGGVVEIQRISFLGNRVFSDRRLRRVLATKQARRLSFFFKNDTFIKDRIEFDKQLLDDFYKKRGFIDFQVVAATSDLKRERSGFLINFNLREGQQYFFGETSVTSSVTGVDADEYSDDIDVKAGRAYNPAKIDAILERMEYRAAQAGYPFVRAAPRVTRNDDTRTLDIEFELINGDRVFVERIDIEGNSTTLDRVIRRQFRLVEGDPFNRREVANATDRIRALDYFNNVSVDAREGSSPSRAVVDVNVEEKPTGSLSFGLGYSTDSGASGQIELIERNFLGRGQTLSAAISSGSTARNISLGFTEPSLYDRDLLVGGEIYYRTTSSDTTDYNTERLGITGRTSFPISENGRLSLGFRISSDEILDVTTGSSQLIFADIGERLTTALTASYTYDRRNSIVDPTSGFIFNVSADFAGLAGDEEYVKATTRAKTYRSLFNEEVVLSAELKGGYLNHFGDGSRIIDRFTLGGASLRGFQADGVGPRDLTADNQDSLGGNLFATATLEASFPIGLPEEYGIHGGVFYQVGSVWDLDRTITGSMTAAVDDDMHIRSSIGVSLFWETALGPLRFDFAKALKKQTYDKTESFRFSVETRF